MKLVPFVEALDENYLKLELYDLVAKDKSIFDFLQSGSLDGIWYWDVVHPENEWLSPRFWETLGYSPSEKKHLASEWRELIFPEDEKLALENFKEHCANPNHPYDQIVRYRHKNGSTVWVRCRGIAIRDSSGRPLRMLGAHNDITQMMLSHQRQRDLWKAQKSIDHRDEFISIASHELRTPLTALKLQLQIIPMTLSEVTFPSKDKTLKLLDNSLRQLDRFSKLVDNLLDISKINSGQLELKCQNVALSDVVYRVLEELQPELKKAGCLIITKLDDSIQGTWDPVRMEQVVMNLLSNALKYGDSKPIEITSRWVNGQACLLVRDHGVGISEENQKKIFERYERVGSTTNSQGLGLGLYITRNIVQAHGGTIKVESELGQGSTFTVTIPP